MIAAHPFAVGLAVVAVFAGLAAVCRSWQKARRVIKRTEREIDQAVAMTKQQPAALPQRHPRTPPKAEEPFHGDGLGDALRRITEGDRG